jgi:protocatechuate 3,4-dioxygenase beta subunit
MRPILVLLLVIVGLLAFLLIADFGGKKASPTLGVPDESPVASTPTNPSTLDPAEASTDDVRTEAATATNDEPRTVADPGDPTVSNAVFGLVQNESGAPVEKATVTLTKAGKSNPFPTEPTREKDKSTLTNAKGEYRFQDVEPFLSYALVVKHPDYKLVEHGSVNVHATGEQEQPPIVLGAGVQVEGFVRDSLGAPIQDANVALGAFVLGAADEKDPNTLHEKTDVGGHYAFKHVDHGVFILTAAAEGFGTVVLQNVRVNEEPLQQDLVLEVAQMIMGRVVSITGEPVPKAMIAAYALNQAQGRQSRSQVKSDDKGEFRIEDIPQGVYSIHAQAPGFDARNEPRIDTGTMDLVIQLVPQPTITGHVLDSASGAPIAQFTALLRQVVPQAEPPMSIPEPDTKREFKVANGEFKLSCRQPGQYIVQANAPGYAGCFSLPVTIAKGQNLFDVNVLMTRGGTIRGRVVDDQGNPVARASVTTRDHEWTDDLFTQTLGDEMPAIATERTAKTKSDGTFQIEGLTPSDYLLDVQHAEYSRTFQVPFRVNENQVTDAGDVRLIRGGVVQGTVWSPQGTPLPGAVVELVAQADPNGTPRNYSEKTDSQGHYVIKGVYPGAYTITALRSADASSDLFVGVGDVKETRDKLQILDGQPIIKDIHFGMNPGGK